MKIVRFRHDGPDRYGALENDRITALDGTIEALTALSPAELQRLNGETMSLAQKLAKVMGGRILVESQPGVGSSFTLEVALRRPAAAATARARPADIGPAVLAVEDDPIGITVLRHVLQRRLKNVDCVTSGREALEAVTRRHYDLILMDLQMPDIDGLQAAAKIRQMNAYKDVPILALTAHSMKGDEDRCRAAGCTGLLSAAAIASRAASE